MSPYNTHKTYTVDEAKKKLEYYCAYQERCHDEVIKKLRELKMIPQAIDVIIAHLINNNFLNEERFACAFARGKFRIKNWGKIRITRELKARNISRYNIDMALKEIPPEEYHNVFNSLAEHQWQIVKEKNLQKKKQKIAGYLIRKGFESNLMYEKLSELSSE